MYEILPDMGFPNELLLLPLLVALVLWLLLRHDEDEWHGSPFGQRIFGDPSATLGEYGPPTEEELAEVANLRRPGVVRLGVRKSAVARHFFTDTKHTRISSTGGRQTINDDPPNVVDEWYENRD